MKLLIALYHPFVLWNAPEWLAPRLQQDFPQHQIKQLAGPKYEGIERAIEDADAVIAWSIRPEQFVHARRLRWLHSPAAAVHQLMFPEIRSSAVVITNAREVHGPVVAEHAIALILALAKRLPSAMHYQTKHKWAQQEIWFQKPTTKEIASSTVVVIGLGSIGRELARRAKGLGARVLAVREHPERGADGADQVVAMDKLDSVLPEADFIVLAAPLTDKTRHIVDAQRIARMRPDAYVVNVSRGPLIDDAALVAALRDGRIAGAALDVFETEPLPPDSPYWRLTNVLITPHTAAVTEKLWERHYGLISENLRRFAAGQPLLAVVEKSKGY